MLDTAAARQAYVAWASQRDDLPVFARPEWLQAVSNGNWCVELTPGRKGAYRRVWPYVPKQRLGLSWASLPPTTPYLGPFWLDPTSVEPEYPPSELGYIAFTVRDPSAAWRFGKACRAMATQVIKIAERPRYGTSLKQKLRRGHRELVTRKADAASDYDTLRRLLLSAPQAGDANHASIFATTQNAKLSTGWVVTNAEGIVQGMAVVAEDQKCAYLTAQVRTQSPHPSTSVVLLDSIIEDLAERGIPTFDMESGYIPGVRAFHASFGALPSWYGQVRLTRGLKWKLLERMRSVTNPGRL